MSKKLRWQSRLACVWSVEKLMPSLEESTLFPGPDELPHEFKDKVFLWTWTFPDKEARDSVVIAMRRWKKHARWLKDTGKQCMRALERGGKNGAYHFHAITHQRWDINEVRAHAESCGFGRLQVTVIPRERASYIAKYLGKPGRFPIPKGARLWACIGYEGVKKNDVRCRITELTVNVKNPYQCMISCKRWLLDGVIISERILRPDWDGNPQEIQNMKVTKENMEHIASLIVGGSIMCLAEYRTCSVRKLEFAEEKKGVLTGKQVVRKIVEHGVEVGSEQITVSEWLPDDADITAVKPPAEKGEPVLIEIAQFSRKYGITAKSIRNLANLGGNLGPVVKTTAPVK